MTLAPIAPPSSPLHKALDLGLDWAARSRSPAGLLVLHLSHLDAPGPRPHHRRIAASLLDGAVQAHGGQVFACVNGDLILLTAPTAAASLATTLAQLFSAESPGIDRLLALWSLPADEPAVRAHLAIPAVPAPLEEDLPVPLGAIAAIEAVLASSPLDQLIRRQSAIHIGRAGLALIYQELSVSLTALEAGIGLPVPFVADPFLFRHLASRMDRLVLDPAAPAPAGPPLHLNLTLSGILSPAFDRLAAAIPRFGVEVSFMEAVTDLPRFTAAHQRLRTAGCRLVLDGLDHQVMALARPAALQPDLLKLEWSPRMAALPSRERRHLNQAVEAFGPDRIVLHRAETEAALAWGRAWGIRRFQGRHVDAILAAERISVCSHAKSCTLRQCIGRAAATGAAGRSGCLDTSLLDAQALASVA